LRARRKHERDERRARTGWPSLLVAMAAAQFAQPYYVLNGALVVSWAVLRSILPGAAAIKKETSGSWFSTRETEIVMLVGFALLSKAKRSSSSHEFASKVFMFGKTAVLLCLWYSSWVAFGAYAALMALVFTVVPTPSFAGTEHVEDMTTAAFEARVLRDGAQDKAGIVWVVMFGADWCEPCTNALPLFASLAQQFKSRRRQFARVHVDKHPRCIEPVASPRASHRARASSPGGAVRNRHVVQDEATPDVYPLPRRPRAQARTALQRGDEAGHEAPPLARLAGKVLPPDLGAKGRGRALQEFARKRGRESGAHARKRG